MEGNDSFFTGEDKIGKRHMKNPPPRSLARISGGLIMRICIFLIAMACLIIYYTNIRMYVDHYVFTISHFRPLDGPNENIYTYFEPLDNTIYITIVLLVFLASTYFATKGAQKERLVWIGLLLAFLEINLTQLVYMAFIIIMVISFLLFKRGVLESRPLKEKDNRRLITYFILYSVLLAIASFFRLSPTFFGRDLLLAGSIILPFILLICCIITFLIIRKNTWGYITALVLLLMDTPRIVPQFRGLISYVGSTIYSTYETGLDPTMLPDIFKKRMYVTVLSCLPCIPSIIAIFLAVFILRRMREEPIRQA
jgi:hypothetical protein